jgi:hypothetical protein
MELKEKDLKGLKGLIWRGLYYAQFLMLQKKFLVATRHSSQLDHFTPHDSWRGL